MKKNELSGPPLPSLGVLERKEMLSLIAQRIAQLPLASKKVLAMYYHEELPISRIAACFNLPAWRINEILTQTVGLLGDDLMNVSSEVSHLRNNGSKNDVDRKAQPTRLITIGQN